ncbi:hypothetical protein [Pyrococcus kukulkanii]|uniref:hypothetical protein n=1 Tax=Pyrococcus kukulkanii TaxID=1609559 RepID=UPI00356405AB
MRISAESWGILEEIKAGKFVVFGISAILLTYGSISFVDYNFHNPSTFYAFPTYTYVDFEKLAGNYTKGLVKVSRWISENTNRDDCLISHPYTLEWIAGFTGRPVVAVTFGHGNPFLNMEQRRKDIELFFTNPSERSKIIEKYEVKYVILGPYVKWAYNVTIKDFEEGRNFRIVFHWWEFYILQVEN